MLNVYVRALLYFKLFQNVQKHMYEHIFIVTHVKVNFMITVSFRGPCPLKLFLWRKKELNEDKKVYVSTDTLTLPEIQTRM